MDAAKNVAPWGFLRPLLRNDANEVGNRQSHDLVLPGSFGREELIRPFLDTCTCRIRSNSVGGKNGLSPSKMRRCEYCNRVRSLATFIPRKNLLRFSYSSSNGNSNGLIVEISGNNAAQIVHLHAAAIEKGGDGASLIARDDSLVVVHDSDEITLHWDTVISSHAIDASPEASTEPSLVRFRIVRSSHEKSSEAAWIHPRRLRHVDNNAGDTERDAINQDQIHSVIPPLCAGEKIPSVNEDLINVNADDKHVLQSSLCLNDAKNEAASDAKLPCETIGTHKELGHMLDEKSSTDEVIDTYGESPSLDENDSDRNSHTEEESAQTESAPLTLPVNFLASSSRSFSGGSSPQTMPSPTRHNSQVRMEGDSQVSGHTTPQTSNLSVKRKFTSECYNELSTIDKASLTSTILEEGPKECCKIAVPISSLTSNQLRRLHRESYDISNGDQSSVRKAALALTLALTSDASAWNLSFMKEYGETGRRKEGPNETYQTQKWMPRLLRGTTIVMHKHDVDS